MTNFNPWQVENPWQAFTYLKCPECSFDTKIKDLFQNHAIENHPLSFVVFGKILKEIKEENIDSNLIGEDYTNEGALSIKQEELDVNLSNVNI